MSQGTYIFRCRIQERPRRFQACNEARTPWLALSAVEKMLEHCYPDIDLAHTHRARSDGLAS